MPSPRHITVSYFSSRFFRQLDKTPLLDLTLKANNRRKPRITFPRRNPVQPFAGTPGAISRIGFDINITTSDPWNNSQRGSSTVKNVRPYETQSRKATVELDSPVLILICFWLQPDQRWSGIGKSVLSREILIRLRLHARRPEEERSVEPTEKLGVQCSMILLQKKIPADAECSVFIAPSNHLSAVLECAATTFQPSSNF
jgi:hypothetical protein